MKSGDIFKREIFEQFVINFIPGSVSIFPYLFILDSYFPIIFKGWKEIYIVFSMGFFITAIAVGLIIESFGGWIESEIWDFILDHKEKTHKDEWWEYLKLKMEIKPIAQKYLRTRVMFMKFDLGLAISLLNWIRRIIMA